jgi:peptidoglycan-associated lipoprotein
MHLFLMRFISLFFVLVSACTYTQKVNDGKFAFERQQYAVAVKLLDKEYKKADTRIERGRLAFFMGSSLKELNKPTEAVQWFKIAYDNQYGIEALRQYALTLKSTGNYKEAIEAFKDLGFEIGSPYEYRNEITACQLALEWENTPYHFEIELAPFNSAYSDFSPGLFSPNQLVFASDRKESLGDALYTRTGRKFSDIFLFDLESEKVTALDIPYINTVEHEANLIIDRTGTVIYFTRCQAPKKEDAFCKIFQSRKVDGAWSDPIPVDFCLPGINYAHPVLSSDNKTMYFTSNDPNGFGGYDIWYTNRNRVGWDEPKPLGRGINTPGNEMFPYLDGDTLYFSSNYHPGLGGLDIFKSFKLASGGWSVPQNLKPPINSGYDDFGFLTIPSDGLQKGYFTSKRTLEGKGEDDIFSFQKIIPKIPEIGPKEEIKDTILAGLQLRIYVLEKIFSRPDDPNSSVIARKPIIGATVNANNELKNYVTGEEGYIQLPVEENQNYLFVASNAGFLTNSTAFNALNIGIDPNNPNRIFELEIVLDKIYLEKEITLKNIYYDFDRWEIREDAKPALNELAAILQLNPKISIELASHTDCRGQDNYNLNLSQRRAQSAVDYLTESGIGSERLNAVGYGESQPVTSCVCVRCTEDEHQQNRRTTFKIIDSGLR